MSACIYELMCLHVTPVTSAAVLLFQPQKRFPWGPGRRALKFWAGHPEMPTLHGPKPWPLPGDPFCTCPDPLVDPAPNSDRLYVAAGNTLANGFLRVGWCSKSFPSFSS